MPEVLTQVDKDDSPELSGRELDAAVAERIMNWTNVQSGCYTPIGQEWCGDDPEGTGGFNRTGRKIIPRYSERIEAAMEVVEAVIPRLPDNAVIKNLGFAQVRMYRYGNDTWNVTFTKRGGSASATAKTLPEAICRAALAATESKK